MREFIIRKIFILSCIFHEEYPGHTCARVISSAVARNNKRFRNEGLTKRTTYLLTYSFVYIHHLYTYIIISTYQLCKK